jgi:hypothetical protein
MDNVILHQCQQIGAAGKHSGFLERLSEKSYGLLLRRW